MPRGGWLHEVRRWACCGLRRTGGPSPGSGAFSSSPYTVPLCWVWGPSIAVLWSCQRIEMCVTVFAFFTYLLTCPRYIRTYTYSKYSMCTAGGLTADEGRHDAGQQPRR